MAYQGHIFLILCRGSDSILYVAKYIKNVSAVFFSSDPLNLNRFFFFLHFCHLFDKWPIFIFNYVLFFKFHKKKTPSVVVLPLNHKETERLAYIVYFVQTTQVKYLPLWYGGQANDPHTALTG